jgi:hypothetical protein
MSFVPPPRSRSRLAPRFRTFRGLPNQSSASDSSCISSARCSIRTRSLLRARLPTLMGALVPQPSPKDSLVSQSRGARACTGDAVTVSSENGPVKVLNWPKADGAEGVSCGRETLQSYEGDKKTGLVRHHHHQEDDDQGDSHRRGAHCLHSCSTIRHVRYSPPHLRRGRAVFSILGAEGSPLVRGR